MKCRIKKEDKRRQKFFFMEHHPDILCNFTNGRGAMFEKRPLRPRSHWFTNGQRQCGSDASDKLSLKPMESIQNGLQPHSGVTLLFPLYFNESYVTSIIAVLTMSTLTLGVNRPLAITTGQ